MLKTLRSLGMLLFLVLLCLAIGQLGVFFMNAHNINWYISLQKPSWTAPNFIFPIVWSLFYVLIALSAWLIWRLRSSDTRPALICWVIQLFFNALWVPLFFGQQNILIGFIIIAVLWLFTLITTILFFRQSKLAGILMLLYLIWVSYAGALNFAILQINH